MKMVRTRVLRDHGPYLTLLHAFLGALLRNDCFKVFVAISALVILCPPGELSMLIDATRIQHLLAILWVVAKALGVAGKIPAAWMHQPLGNIIRVL